mmetsp:Transcript_39255/g.28985  ORF Transcript_39255/g.28985 Transcript_39255/m.28985 type:complete len:236 (+) Transcript_39255:216-923(+)
MSIARINVSHGTSKTNQRLLRKFQESRRLRPHKTCSMLLELRGREIRISESASPGGVVLNPGQQLFIDCSNPMEKSTTEVLHCSYRELPRAVKPNDIIYIDDGKIICLVTECTHKGVAVEVKGGGVLKSHRAIKIPGGKHEVLPILHPLDELDIINYGMKCGFDFIAVPCTVRKKDIQHVRDFLGPAGAHIQILAKVDTLEAIHNFEEIVKAADGVVINRVELALELPAEKLMLA